MCRVLIADVIKNGVYNLEKAKKLHHECSILLMNFVRSGKNADENLIGQMYSEITIQLEKKIKEAEAKEPAPKERINLEKYSDSPRKVSSK